MNLRQLEIFRAVMRAGTTSAAARDLGVSQPAVSNMLKHIESTLRLNLFERRAGRLWPTQDAKRLYAEVEPLFLFFQSVQKKVFDIRDGKSGNLRIVATPSTANSIVPPALKLFLENRPALQVSLDTRRMEGVIEHIEHNFADIGMTLTFCDHPHIAASPIHMGKMVCALHRDHKLTRKEVIRPSDLVKVSFISMEKETPLGNLIHAAFANSGENVNWSIETRYCNTACSLVDAGVGVALVDEYVLANGSYPNIVTRQFIPNIPLTAYVLFSKERSVPALAKDFVIQLKKSLKYLPVHLNDKL